MRIVKPFDDNTREVACTELNAIVALYAADAPSSFVDALVFAIDALVTKLRDALDPAALLSAFIVELAYELAPYDDLRDAKELGRRLNARVNATLDRSRAA